MVERSEEKLISALVEWIEDDNKSNLGADIKLLGTDSAGMLDNIQLIVPPAEWMEEVQLSTEDDLQSSQECFSTIRLDWCSQHDMTRQLCFVKQDDCSGDPLQGDTEISVSLTRVLQCDPELTEDYVHSIIQDKFSGSALQGDPEIPITFTEVLQGDPEVSLTSIQDMRTVPILNPLEDDGCIYCLKEQVHICSEDLLSQTTRLRGGLIEIDYTPDMVNQAIESASKHGIQLVHGRANPGLGNCAIESVLYNIADRKEFTDNQKVLLHPLEARPLWVCELQTIIETNYSDLIPDNINNGNTEELWDKLKQDGAYEIELMDDLMLNAISRGCRKRLLIFNTSTQAADPSDIGTGTSGDKNIDVKSKPPLPKKAKFSRAEIQ